MNQKDRWIFQRVVKDGGIPITVSIEKKGYIATRSKEGFTALYTVRQTSPLSLSLLMKYLSGNARTKALEEHLSVQFSDRRYQTHHRAAQSVLLGLPLPMLESLIECSINNLVPDLVCESVDFRSILVLYGTARLIFFRGRRERGISDQSREDIVPIEDAHPPYQLRGKTVPVLITDGHRETARTWAKQFTTILPRKKLIPVAKKRNRA